MATLILARNYTQATAYARHELGLAPGAYRIVTGPPSISGLRDADIHLVPGWKRRHDHFALKSAMRWTKLTVIDGEQFRLGLELAAEIEAGDDGGGDDESTLEVAKMAPVPEIDTGGEPDVADLAVDPEPEPEVQTTVRRRRRRCPDCNVLVDPDDVEAHAASHDAE